MNMSRQMSEPRTPGDRLAEGKTKIVFADLADPLGVILEAKSDITAGDGAKHDIIEGKEVLATETTCNVFELLHACGIPVAYNERVTAKSFSAARSTMLLLEIVVRREAHGSYCVRYPHIPKGTIFPKLVFEVFLKTSGKRWRDMTLPCDDPHAVYVPEKDAFALYDVKKSFVGQEPFGFVPTQDIFGTIGTAAEVLQQLHRLATKTFLVLEKQWQLFGRRLVDFKIECDDMLRVSDVVDNDSWRLLKDGRYEDKQVYREGGALSEVAANYRRVSELTQRFGLPTQRIILWRGSESDNAAQVSEALSKYSGGLAGVIPGEGGALPLVRLHVVTCSMHKLAEQGLRILRMLEQECPDSVILALIGRSNGAGPTLSAHTTLPLINIPATAKDFPESAWSSLDMPSEVPCMTVLRPGEAALAALNILAARNPALYAALRGRLEQRFINSLVL